MKLHFTPRARLDLIGIADYIRTRNPAAALAVRQAILGSLQSVAMFPEIGRQQSVEGVRQIHHPQISLLDLLHRGREAEEIVVLTIQHPARRREYSDV